MGRDLTVRRSALSPEKRALLEKRLRGDVSSSSQVPAIERRPTHTGAVLSFAQQRLWFLDQLVPASPFYNIPAAIRLPFPVNVPMLQRSVNEIVRRHEALRTTFRMEEGQPMQVIAPVLDVALPVVDLRDLPEGVREVEARRLAAAEAQEPFDLATGPLLRMQLVRLAEADYVFLLTLHHIVADGWS